MDGNLKISTQDVIKRDQLYVFLKLKMETVSVGTPLHNGNLYPKGRQYLTKRHFCLIFLSSVFFSQNKKELRSTHQVLWVLHSAQIMGINSRPILLLSMVRNTAGHMPITLIILPIVLLLMTMT